MQILWCSIKPGSREVIMNAETIVFEDWERVLRETVPPEKQWEWRTAVAKFRHWLRETGKEPTVEVFKEHLAWKRSYLPPEEYEIRRQALRWYWEKGKKNGTQEPGAGSQNGGGTNSRRVNAPARNRPEPVDRVLEFASTMSDVPTKGAADLGGPPWERKMVACIRARHLAWKTETTYRHWARRLGAVHGESGDRGAEFFHSRAGGFGHQT